jgi:hypothetical protein
MRSFLRSLSCHPLPGPEEPELDPAVALVYTVYMKVLLRRLVLVSAGAAVVGSLGCGSSSAGNTAAQSTLPATLAVTADWLHHTLSLVDFDALVTKADAGDSVRLGQVDLSAYAQGPYTVKITPDGKTALVTLSSGFFSIFGASALIGVASVPTGPSELLFVDIASKSITATLDTGDGATGIAITNDGTRAFVCHVGTSMVTIVDVKAHQILSQVDLGGSYAEEVTLDDTNTVGAVTYLDPTTNEKDLRTFSVADMASTLSPPIPLNSDAAGVPFFPGTKTVYVVLSYNPLTSPASGYALVDATNPSAPVKLVETLWNDAMYVDYQAIPAPARGTVLVPVTTGGMLTVREYSLGTGDVVLKNTFTVAPTGLFGAFGAAVDSMGRMVLTMPAEHQLAVLDLTSSATFVVPWFPEAGPMGIALR